MVCVKLPYADGVAFGNLKYTVGNNISPLDWYALIKYSCGYVGNNMHPIVTSIHNGVPFYSFDNYGINKQNGQATNGESSKIYHLLHTAGLLKYRVFVNKIDYDEVRPTPETVLSLLETFDFSRENAFAQNYYCKYKKMMDTAYSSFNNIINRL